MLLGGGFGMSKGEMMFWAGVICVCLSIVLGVMLTIVYFAKSKNKETQFEEEKKIIRKSMDDFLTELAFDRRELQVATVLKEGNLTSKLTVISDCTEILDETELLEE